MRFHLAPSVVGWGGVQNAQAAVTQSEEANHGSDDLNAELAEVSAQVRECATTTPPGTVAWAKRCMAGLGPLQWCLARMNKDEGSVGFPSAVRRLQTPRSVAHEMGGNGHVTTLSWHTPCRFYSLAGHLHTVATQLYPSAWK